MLERNTVSRALDGGNYSWLIVMPIARHHFDLSSVELRDTLAIHYGRPLLRVPANCDGCGAAFDFIHALDCKKGGLITQRHEVRDALGDIVAVTYKEVVREPIVREADEARGIPALVADLGVRGVWQPQAEALFDVRVVDTDAQSYVQRAVSAVLASAEREKKRKYSQAIEARHASFFPFVLSVDGLLAREARFVLKHFADRLATKWSRPYPEVMGWVKTRLSFATLRATNRRLRGSRTKWRSDLGLEDGAGLALVTQ